MGKLADPTVQPIQPTTKKQTIKEKAEALAKQLAEQAVEDLCSKDPAVRAATVRDLHGMITAVKNRGGGDDTTKTKQLTNYIDNKHTSKSGISENTGENTQETQVTAQSHIDNSNNHDDNTQNHIDKARGHNDKVIDNPCMDTHSVSTIATGVDACHADIENNCIQKSTEETPVKVDKRKGMKYNKRDTIANPTCGAKGKRTGQPCGNPAGFRTDHLGHGRCYLHGGCAKGAKKGNTNAVTHGMFQKIYAHTMTEDERALAEDMVTDKVQQLDDEIVIITIRERRMMERIAKLVASHDEMILVGKQEIEGSGSSENPGGGGWTQEHKNYDNKLNMIHKYEEALTKIQVQKAKLIETKHKIEMGVDDDGKDTSRSDALVDCLKASMELAMRSGKDLTNPYEDKGEDSDVAE